MSMFGILWTCLYWVLAVAVGLFSFFFVAGMALQWKEWRTGPQLRGTEAQDAEETIPAGPAYEIPTLNIFLAAATSGIMPDGNKTDLPLFPMEEMVILSKKYEDWAPDPFNKLPGPPGILGPSSPVSPAPLIRWMHILGGLDDILAMGFGSRTPPLSVERSFKAMKTRVWLGLVPITDARWKAKDLDATENIEEALAIIQQVVDVFKHLAKPAIQGDLRNINNKLWAEIDVFQDACNAVRTTKGEPIPDWNLTKMWEAFHKHHYNSIEQQARSWTFTHLKTLHNIWKHKFIATFQSGRELNDKQATVKIDYFDMMIMRKIQDLQFEADLCVRSRTDGFLTASREMHPLLGKINAPKEELDRGYESIEGSRMKAMRGAFEKKVQERTKHRRSVAPVPAFLEAPSVNTDREFTHKEIQSEIETPLAMQVERWVAMQMAENVDRFGLVIYRLAYGPNEEEWKYSVRKLEAGIETGLEGLVGIEDVKLKMTLHWIDGRDENIPEGDIDAARSHFKSTSTIPSGLATTALLAITPDTLKSLFSKVSSESLQDHKNEGDFRGFLYVIDADFDPSKDEDVNGKNGYKGSFKIIDQLVWTDLFANFVTSHAQNLKEYWALAMGHPWGVYVGPTTAVRRRLWREMNGGLGMLLEASKNVSNEGSGGS
ncbi:uncharacterized protein RAG0_15549 [Rhynchosporium agropyri]|uniref:Uncharacterized protein n=1 Tax=Rhynchosporium agropyri TaxID=914238 RepID=A0A1E1LLL6_9HELO|nr:uncharacterized protein RAG0_15549 [Rhynchosporium agropyri]